MNFSKPYPKKLQKDTGHRKELAVTLEIAMRVIKEKSVSHTLLKCMRYSPELNQMLSSGLKKFVEEYELCKKSYAINY